MTRAPRRDAGSRGRPPRGGHRQRCLRDLRGVVGSESRSGLVAAGGVFSPADAYRKLRLGASLVQVYTGLVYRGPGLVKEILAGLIELIEANGAHAITDVVGAVAE